MLQSSCANVHLSHCLVYWCSKVREVHEFVCVCNVLYI